MNKTYNVGILIFPREVHMNRVTGIGGIFFKAKDPKAMQAWYRRHLGIDVQDWGGAAFRWTDADGKPVGGTTIWSTGIARPWVFTNVHFTLKKPLERPQKSIKICRCLPVLLST